MSDLSYYNAQEKHWVSPRLVLLFYDDLVKKYRDQILESKYKKAHEAKSVALSVLAHHKNNKNKYLMQVPKEVNESPDIVTMFLDKPKENERGIQLRLHDIEVIEYKTEETQELSDFLIEKKLDPTKSKKAYDDKTTILCHVRKATVIYFEKIHTDIKKLSPKAHVEILTKIGSGEYNLTQVWPSKGSQNFNVLEEAKNYPKPDSLLLGLGVDNDIIVKHTDLPLPSIEEVFELDKLD